MKPGQPTQGMANLLALAGVIEPFEKASEIVERYLLVSASDNTIRKETSKLDKSKLKEKLNGSDKAKTLIIFIIENEGQKGGPNEAMDR